MHEARVATIPQDALQELAEVVLAEQAFLAALPPPIERDTEQHKISASSHARCRAARTAFMARHGAWLYDQLTVDCTVPLRLAELVRAAAEHTPALFATPAQWAAESGRLQAQKEGWEIEQGIFVQGVLRDARCGAHLVESMLHPLPRSLELLTSFRQSGRAEVGPVHIERRGEVAHLTVCNDAHLNAEDNELAVGLEVCVDLALLDAEVRVGVVRGGVMSHPKYRGRRVFCSGINLKHLYAGRISYIDFLLGREFGYVNKIRHGLRGLAAHDSAGGTTVEKPWIAAVDSFAIGGGLQLMLVFDHVVASRGTHFVLPAANEGIIPGLANLRLPMRAGNRLARDMILRGRVVHAEEPDAALLVDEVVEEAHMEAAITAAAKQMRSDAIVPNRRMLRMAEESLDQFRAYMAEFALEQARRIHAPDVLSRLHARYA
ncbi:(3,5-dihydroxyphenyl)acetyl-CoA 1,2-dioxygenase DpgC [Variovorax boronicumulans]|uniref:(3,5-dihydroxyphenyl)acetyl-CoA 1,2-dioxygenase DpgC n=1 Tax=Variovorax boronicumulans TaxID=436515 RepID=UPI00339B35D8